MKKLLIAVLAIAGLASCTNSDVEYDSVQQQIGLSPITENRTRAMVTSTTFPSENFRVWAWYKQIEAGKNIAQWQADGATQQEYIKKAEFGKPDGSSVWSGANAAYYWPKLGSLLFAGYYPATETLATKVSYTFNVTQNMMTIDSYSPTSDAYVATGFVKGATNCEEDLMYFKMTPTSVNTPAASVPVTFQHALSWIKVTLKQADATDAKITVKSVTFTDVNTTGTGVVADSDDNGEIEDIVWTPAADKADINVLNDGDNTTNDAIVLSTGGYAVPKEPVVIPQEMSGNLVVVYTIESTDGSKFEETKTITLNTLEDDETTPNTINEWEAGKCYTYAIAIGTSEITIAPTVTEWVDVKVPVAVQ